MTPLTYLIDEQGDEHENSNGKQKDAGEQASDPVAILVDLQSYSWACSSISKVR